MSNALKRGKQVAFLVDGNGPSSPTILGGKGAGLVELAREGVRVPPAFTVATGVARAFAQHQRLPNRLERQLRWQIAALEKQTGKRFGDPANPLLVSVRSGALVSMPGMMDTVLNLGMNEAIVKAMAEREGNLFAYDCYRRFLRIYGEIVMGIPGDALDNCTRALDGTYLASATARLTDRSACTLLRDMIRVSKSEVPSDPWEQLMAAVKAVVLSWNSERAVAYRKLNKINNGLGTAVNVQAMVFGNRGETSCTGVVFSHDLRTGELGMWGEFLPNAQGEEVVSGVRTPVNICGLYAWNADVYDELEDIVCRLAEKHGAPVDIEFTVESGTLYILQVRNAKLTAEAAITLAVREVWAGKKTKAQVLAQISQEQVELVRAAGFDPEALAEAAATRLVARGLPASQGAVTGRVVLECSEAVAAAARGEKVVLVREDTKPEDLTGMMAAAAIITMNGGTSCHAAVVARGLGKPCVSGCGGSPSDFPIIVSVDGSTGLVVAGAVPLSSTAAKKEVSLFLRWVRDVESTQWRQPQLVFSMYNESVPLSQLISDFYLSEAMYKAGKGTALADATYRLMVQVHTEAAERLATYLVIAVSGELRRTEKDWVAIRPYYLRLMGNYVIAWGDLKSERPAYHGPFVEHASTLPPAKHIEFLELAVACFEKGEWADEKGNCGAGGPKWAEIAQVALDFLTGKKTHTIFCDHAFDKHHNGGLAFDKNKMLAYEDDDEIIAQLNSKQEDNTVTQLYTTTCGYGEPSSEVMRVFEKGLAAGIWKYHEPSPRRTPRPQPHISEEEGQSLGDILALAIAKQKAKDEENAKKELLKKLSALDHAKHDFI